MDTPDAFPISRGPVLVAAPLVDGWLIFYAKTLSHAGYEVTLATNLDSSVRDQDHVNVLHNFSQAPFCSLVDIRDAAAIAKMRFDFALAGIHGASPQEERDGLLSLIGRTPLRAIIFRRYNSRFPSMVRLLGKEMAHPFIRRSARVLVEGYQNASFLLNLLSSPGLIGIVPHQRVTCRGMADGLADRVERDYLFNFLGGYDGEVGAERTLVVDQLESRFHLSGGEHELNIEGKKVRTIWYADRPGNTRKRPMHEYFARVGNSYFTLCPSGDSETAHRVLEAIHCGSIPILNKKRMAQYGLPLEHGKNCWLVHDRNWASAVTTLSSLGQDKIIEMQGAVRNLAHGEASIPSLERKCLILLGLISWKN
jgi:hypothetical protein